MKKTIRINISGYIFNIDEDAYERLQHYLNSINKQFVDTNEGNEIIADVESRIAELFQERIGDRKEVINLTDIEYITEIMGKPEDFEDLQDESQDQPNPEIQSKKTSRRIYRDPENRVLSGLSAGLGNYFGIDPTIVRVIFVLMTLFYGTSFLVYIILWIFTPEAKTRTQKLEMRGQDINLSNIESSIKSEFRQVQNNFSKWKKSRNREKLNSNINEMIKYSWKTFGIFFKIVLIIIGIFFLLTGIGLLGAMTGLFFFNNTILSPLSWNNISFPIKEIIALFTDRFNANVFMISSYLLVLVPVVSIIYFGLRFIFKFKTKNKYIGLYAGSTWLVSLLVLIVSSVKIAYEMRTQQEITQTYSIEKKSTDTLYLELSDNLNNEYWNNKNIRFGDIGLSFDDKVPTFYGKPSLSIEKSENNLTEFSITKMSHGMNDQEAVKYAKNIEYEWQQDDSIIYFHRYFQLAGNKKLRNQRLNATLKIPVGKVVYIGKNINLLCSYIENKDDYDSDEMVGHYWVMTFEGLQLYGESKMPNNFEESDNEQNIKIDTISGFKNKENVNKEIEDMKAELDSM